LFPHATIILHPVVYTVTDFCHVVGPLSQCQLRCGTGQCSAHQHPWQSATFHHCVVVLEPTACRHTFRVIFTRFCTSVYFTRVIHAVRLLPSPSKPWYVCKKPLYNMTFSPSTACSEKVSSKSHSECLLPLLASTEGRPGTVINARAGLCGQSWPCAPSRSGEEATDRPRGLRSFLS
jgi:hypothetical protein